MLEYLLILSQRYQKDGYVMLKLNAKVSQKIREHKKDGMQYLAPRCQYKKMISTIARVKKMALALLIGGLISDDRKEK